MSRIELIYYNSDSKSFSSTSDKLKDCALITAASLAITTVPKIIKTLTSHYGAKRRDEILNDKNIKINELIDNYNAGIKSDTSPESVKKYAIEMHKLTSAVLASIDPDNLGYYIDPDTKIRTELKPTIFNVTIAPFINLIRSITIRELHILPGTTIGADRRSFELVFDPEHSNPEDVARQPFRNVVFRHKWPAHGFNVTKMGANEANDLINEVINFLANNPKFLSIRVK